MQFACIEEKCGSIQVVVFYEFPFSDRQENSINRYGVEGLAEHDRTSVSIPPEDEGYAPGEVQRDERSSTVWESRSLAFQTILGKVLSLLIKHVQKIYVVERTKAQCQVQSQLTLYFNLISSLNNHVGTLTHASLQLCGRPCIR